MFCMYDATLKIKTVNIFAGALVCNVFCLLDSSIIQLMLMCLSTNW